MRVRLREIAYCLKKEFKQKVIDITDEVIFDVFKGRQVELDKILEALNFVNHNAERVAA